MRAILFFTLLALYFTPALASHPSPEDEALFRRCVEGYFANCNSFPVLEFKYRYGVADSLDYDAVYQGDFSSFNWTQRFHIVKHHEYERDEVTSRQYKNPVPQINTTIFSPHGYLAYIADNHCIFNTTGQLLKLDQALLDFDRFGSKSLSGYLAECQEGTLTWERLSDSPNRPLFLIDKHVTIEFDPDRGYLPVLCRFESGEDKQGYSSEYRIVDAQQFPGSRWFPVKIAQKSQGSKRLIISEVTDLDVDKPLRSSDFDLTLPAGISLMIIDDNVTLTQPLTIRAKDHPNLFWIPLKQQFHNTLFNSPRDIPRFIYNKPMALWLLAPYLVIPFVLILALIAFRLYRGRSTGNA